jgi:hypothetical protein
LLFLGDDEASVVREPRPGRMAWEGVVKWALRAASFRAERLGCVPTRTMPLKTITVGMVTRMTSMRGMLCWPEVWLVRS